MASFLREFVRYVGTRTDAPADFHLHSGMVALAAAIGNKVWCDGWSRHVYPNLWVVNIAPSGFGKSVPLDMAQSILQQARLGQRVLPSSFSQEGLSKALEQQPSSVWFIQEFAAFQGMLNRSYNDGMMQWLTDIYDVPEEYTRTLMSGIARLRSPAVSILAASSPDWFAASFKESALRGGFLARFLYCPCFEPAAYVGHPGPRDDDPSDDDQRLLASHEDSTNPVVLASSRIDAGGEQSRVRVPVGLKAP